jgi:hypothetical protein
MGTSIIKINIMKKNIIEHLFRESVTTLKRSLLSDRRSSGFETIIIPVERKQFSDYILYTNKFRVRK